MGPGVGLRAVTRCSGVRRGLGRPDGADTACTGQGWLPAVARCSDVRCGPRRADGASRAGPMLVIAVALAPRRRAGGVATDGRYPTMARHAALAAAALAEVWQRMVAIRPLV